jgi:outer membrane protein OmpA-like peptidoglycan-associated protein
VRLEKQITGHSVVRLHTLKPILRSIDYFNPYAGGSTMQTTFCAFLLLFSSALWAQEAESPEPEPTNYSVGFNYIQIDSIDVPDGMEQVLQEIYKLITNNPAIESLQVKGYADSTGGAAYNMQLSRRRAEKVRDALVDLGIPLEKIQVEAFGETKPLINGEEARARSINRRVELNVNMGRQPASGAGSHEPPSQ